MNAARSSFGKAQPHVAKSGGEGTVTRIAAVQLASGPNVKGNLQEAGRLIEMAVAQGAKLVALPEYFAIMGLRDQDKVKAREKPGEGPIQEFLSSTARRHGIWLVGGSVPLEASTPDKLRNSSWSTTTGQAAARSTRSTCSASRWQERTKRSAPSSRQGSGDSGRAVRAAGAFHLLRPAIPRTLPRDEAGGLLLVPSALPNHRQAHWETLIRARAIENLAYVLAPAQGGYHLSGRETHGDSMIVDPWGVVLDRLPRGSGVVVAGVNLQHLRNLRQSLPALTHRTLHRC